MFGQEYGDTDELSRDEIVENVVDALESGDTCEKDSLSIHYGDWLVSTLEGDERVKYDEFHEFFVSVESDL